MSALRMESNLGGVGGHRTKPSREPRAAVANLRRQNSTAPELAEAARSFRPARRPPGIRRRPDGEGRLLDIEQSLDALRLAVVTLQGQVSELRGVVMTGSSEGSSVAFNDVALRGDEYSAELERRSYEGEGAGEP